MRQQVLVTGCAGQLCLHLRRHRHASDPATVRSTPSLRPRTPCTVSATCSDQRDAEAAERGIVVRRRGGAATLRLPHDLRIGERQLVRVVSRGPVVAGDVGEHQPGAHLDTARSRGRHVAHRGPVGEHDVDVQTGACSASTSRCVSGAKPSVSPGCGSRLRTTSVRAAVDSRAAPEVGDEQVRDHAGEPRARARAPPSRPRHRGQRLGAGRRVAGSRRDREHPARGRGDLDLAADHGVGVGSSGSTPRTRAMMSSGARAIGSTRPWAPSSRPTQSRPSTWSPSSSQSATMSRLPTACWSISPSLANRCWSTRAQVPPHSSSPQSAAERLPQVAGRQAAELLAQPARGAAVVGDGDDRGQARRRPGAAPPGRRPARGRRRARRRLARRARSPHSRPRSRWSARASSPSGAQPARRSPRSSRRCGACRRCSRSPRS